MRKTSLGWENTQLQLYRGMPVVNRGQPLTDCGVPLALTILIRTLGLFVCLHHNNSLSHATMVHAPEITEYIKTAATKLEAVSDHVDDVNKLKGGETAFDAESKFDAEKDKAGFRRYEEACDRVKNFYAVSSSRVSATQTTCPADTLRSSTRSRRSSTTSASASRWRTLCARA